MYTSNGCLLQVARLTSDLGSCTASPAATLLRRKRRKRWPGTPREEERITCSQSRLPDEVRESTRERITCSSRLRRREEANVAKSIMMQTSESNSSNSISATSESSKLSSNFHSKDSNSRDEEDEGQDYLVRNTIPSVDPLSVMEILDNIIDVDGTSHDGFWDTPDEDAFLDNKNKLMQKVRKVTVVHASHFVTEPDSEKVEVRRRRSEEHFSTDSLETRGRCGGAVNREEDESLDGEDSSLEGENSSLEGEDSSLGGKTSSNISSSVDTEKVRLHHEKAFDTICASLGRS